MVMDSLSPAWMSRSLRRGASNARARAVTRRPACDARRAVSKEEEQLVWQALEHVRESYREPMILFYREEQSVARVAEALELSEDAVKKRLSRGRRMLQHQLAETVTTALANSKPSKAFTAGVLAGLSGLMSKTATAAGASTAATVAKSGAGVLWGTGLGLAFLNLLLHLPVIRWMNKTNDDAIRSDKERQLFQQFRFWNRCGLAVFVVAALSSIWWQPFIDSFWVRSMSIPGLMVLFYIPMIWYARRLGKRVEQLRVEEGTYTPPRPLIESDDRRVLTSKTYQVFGLSALLVIAWPTTLAIRATDWSILASILAAAIAISLVASRMSLQFPKRSFVFYQLNTSAILLVGIAAMAWRWQLWTPGVSDFVWFFVAISGMTTTAAVLGILAWKRIYGQHNPAK